MLGQFPPFPGWEEGPRVVCWGELLIIYPVLVVEVRRLRKKGGWRLRRVRRKNPYFYMSRIFILTVSLYGRRGCRC